MLDDTVFLDYSTRPYDTLLFIVTLQLGSVGVLTTLRDGSLLCSSEVLVPVLHFIIHYHFVAETCWFCCDTFFIHCQFAAQKC